MSILLDKSNQNIRAATLLIEQHQCYAASVHCAYYSCFQIVMYLLKEEYNVHDVRQTRNLWSPFGTHEETTNLLVQKIREKVRVNNLPAQAPGALNRFMETLRNARQKADYKNEVIDEWAGDFAYKEALKARQLLIELHQLSITKDGSSSI